ncbi:GGDEF domain-containing protein [Aureimonas sp. SA4125]|uniref:GGDEF domain-containing protein n=1 Tax=Aureimonas sp. SA4125 TaxID=2826993 RepID=UPI001CC57E25|nr:GGDEF domain-containing protein [Aureimonas sp. SA4125]BDA85524.1 GGDEF domain-containing protein [Aureimonas sp. SA4125]
MSSRKAEIAVLALLLPISGAVALVYVLLSQFSEMPPGASPEDLLIADFVQRLCLGAELMLAVAVAICLFLVLPMIRAQSREKGELHMLTDDLRRRSSEMELAALTDGMTGLNNRRYFDEAFAQYLDEFSRIGRPVGLMIIDLDHFKSINDTYGHDVGDEVLRAVSRCLLEYTRHHDFVARLGGEEFAVIVPNMEREALWAFAERLRLAVERLGLDVGNVRLRITMSVGLAIAQGGGTFDPADLLKRADVNLYNAKQAGRNRIHA